VKLSIKNTLTNLVDNSNHLSKKQQELENLSHQVSGELKTEISQVKDEIFHELGKINDLLTAT
jgi:gas vesicle protein